MPESRRPHEQEEIEVPVPEKKPFIKIKYIVFLLILLLANGALFLFQYSRLNHFVQVQGAMPSFASVQAVSSNPLEVIASGNLVITPSAQSIAPTAQSAVKELVKQISPNLALRVSYNAEVSTKKSSQVKSKSTEKHKFSFFNFFGGHKEKKEKPESAAAKIAIVIDDLGEKNIQYYLLKQIPAKITLGIIPGEKDSQEIVHEYSTDSRFELMMHMPMQTLGSGEDAESARDEHRTYPYFISNLQSPSQMQEMLDRAYQSLDDGVLLKGLSNHQGSLITSSPNCMVPIVDWSRKKNMYFLDSMTTASSRGYEIAHKRHLPSAYNKIFIDSQDNDSYIRSRLLIAVNLARQNGQIIVVGNINNERTLKVLKDMVPELNKLGIIFVFVSQILS